MYTYLSSVLSNMYSFFFLLFALVGVSYTPDHVMKWQALMLLVIFLEYMLFL